MRKQWRFLRSSGHRSKSQQKTTQNRDSKTHVSSRKRFNRNLRMVQEPAERLYFRLPCSLGPAATTQNPHRQTQEGPIMFTKMRLIQGKSANTRTAPPEPPSSLIGATIKNAPVSGISLKSVRFSR